MGALLSCKDLSKKFSTRNGPKVVFNSLSMVLDKGEGLFVCGPNGTGKTTLLSILAGLVQLSGGRIDLGDEELTPFNHKIRNRVGFAPASENSLFLNATVAENLEFWGRLQDVSNNQHDKILSLAERWGFTEYLDARVREISSGFRRRVAIARAFLHDPVLVLLDEPFAFLDTENQERTLSAMEGWLATQRGALVLSSNIDFKRGANWKTLNLAVS